jgi:hypothetical protein
MNQIAQGTEFMNWLGSPAQVAQLVLLLIALVAAWPKLRQQTLDRQSRIEAAKTEEIKEYKAEVRSLKGEIKVMCDELRDCEEECAKELRRMHEEIWAMRKQNIAEQISLINIILKTVDAPELHALLEVMEKIKAQLTVAVENNPRNPRRGSDG